MSDQSPQGFPRTLLQQPIEVRRHYFETKVVAHHHLKQVYEDLLHAVRYPPGTSLICVVGPTGVGKTTLLQPSNHTWSYSCNTHGSGIP